LTPIIALGAWSKFLRPTFGEMTDKAVSSKSSAVRRPSRAAENLTKAGLRRAVENHG